MKKETLSQTELDLRYKALKIWQGLPDKFQMRASVFKSLYNEFGYNITSRVLYLYYKNRVSTLELEHQVGQVLKSEDIKAKGSKILVFCHQPWWSEQGNKDYLFELKNVFVDMQADVKFDEVPYRQSLFSSAKEMKRMLSLYAQKEVYVVTYGVASLEFRYLLEQSQMDLAHVKGWLNVCGLLYGTSLTPVKGWVGRFLRYWQQEYHVPESLFHRQTYCGYDLKGNSLNMISVLNFFSKRDEHELDVRGPHDGYVSHLDYMNYDGLLYPLWTLGEGLSPKVYRKRLQSCMKHLMNLSQSSIEKGSSREDVQSSTPASQMPSELL